MAALIRPGENCQDCGSLLVPHCPHRPWWKCGWVRCSRCRAYGHHKAWVPGRYVPPPDEATEELPGDEAKGTDGASPGE